MKKSLKILKNYPLLFDNKPNFDFECQDGWFNLINKMCYELKEFGDYIYFVQIKEKFGGLRAYYNYKNISDSFHNQKLSKDGVDKIDKIIQKYESESREICEGCGNKGKIENIGNWLQCLCLECRKIKILKSIR